MSESASEDRPLTRRAVLSITAVAGTGLALTACTGNSTPVSESTSPPPPTQDDKSGSPQAPGGAVLTGLSSVPVGGAVFASSADERYVVSQPSKGKIACFSAICTHQGCGLGTIAGDTANCPCHGSQFNVFTGAVIQGPATNPLSPVTVAVEGTSIVLRS